MMKYIGMIAGAALLVFVVYKTYAMATLDDGLDRKLQNGAVILDVRTPGEYETGHIDGSVNIALSKLRKATIPFDTNTVIITCCSHGLRSVKAVNVLKRRGYKHVYNGGAWSDLQTIADKQAVKR
jgi:phage shock protein E